MRVILGFWVIVCSGVVGCSGRGDSDEPVSRVREAVIAIGPEIGTEAPVLIQKDLGWNPSVGTNGSGFLAATTIAGEVRGVRVDGNGQVLDPVWLSIGGTLRVGADQIYPNVAFGAGRYLVTWTEAEIPDDFSSDVVRGRFVKPDGTVEGSGSFVISAGNALYSTAAWNGSNFVVGWLGFGAAGEGANVHTALIDANGAQVPGSHHAVSTSNRAGEPRLAVSSSQALIAWYEYVQSPTGESTSTIYGARIAPDGTIQDPGGRPLSDGNTYQDTVQVASDGSGFLVVWKSGSDPAVVRGSLVGADGALIARDFAIPATTAKSGLPSVTFDGSRYLVAWADERNDQSVYGVHVSTTGAVADDETRLTEGRPRNVDSGSDRTGLAFNGSNYLLTFLGTGVQGTLLSPDLDIEVDTIGLTAVPNTQGYPQNVWNGQNYMVNWINELADWNDTSARMVRISGTGSVLDSPALILSGDDKPFNAMPASNRQNTALVSWSNVGGDVRSHWLRTVSAAGVLGAPREFSGVEDSSYVALASNGNNYFAVAEQGNAVVGYVVDPSGTAGPEIELASTGNNVGSNVHAAGDGYLVSFGGPGTQLLPVTAQGVPGTAFQLSAELSHPRVATNGEHSLIVWAGSNSGTVQAQRFEQGALVGSPIVLAEQNGGYPSVAWDGSSYFVAWDVEGYTIRGRSVAADGTVGELVDLVDAESSGATLASDGDGQLLLSYIRWYEHAQTRRVTSRLLGRDATTTPEGGAGGEGNAGSGGSNTGTAGGSNTGGTVASGGTSSAGAAGEVTTAGTSSAGSSGSPGSSGSSAGGAAGVAGVAGTAGSAGTGGPDLPPFDCTISPARRNGGLPIWMAAAALSLGLVRRRRATVASR